MPEPAKIGTVQVIFVEYVRLRGTVKLTAAGQRNRATENRELLNAIFFRLCGHYCAPAQKITAKVRNLVSDACFKRRTYANIRFLFTQGEDTPGLVFKIFAPF